MNNQYGFITERRFTDEAGMHYYVYYGSKLVLICPDDRVFIRDFKKWYVNEFLKGTGVVIPLPDRISQVTFNDTKA